MTAPTFTYTYDPTNSDTDRLRLLMGDTDVSNSGANCLFCDEEYDYFNAEGNGNWHLAAHHACVAAASKYSQMADKTLGPMSIKYSSISNQYRAQAVEEFGNATNSANVSPVPFSYMQEPGTRDIEDEEDVYVPPFFQRNQDDNQADSSAQEDRTHWTFG